MESSKNADSKNTTTISHDADASEIANHVESSPTTSSHGQASSLVNDQSMAAQPQHNNVDEQQPQSTDFDKQQPGSDAAMNPWSSQQELPNQIENVPNQIENVPNQIENVPNQIENVPNQIENVPNRPVAQQDQQLFNNDLNPQLPGNEGQQNGQPRQAWPRPRLITPRRRIPVNRGSNLEMVPHFHFMFGNQYWTFNDFSQRVPVVELPPPPIQPNQLPTNICHRLPMFPMTPYPCPPMSEQQNDQPNRPPYLRPQLPPLVSRWEIERGIFEEIYAHGSLGIERTSMFGVERCTCQNFVGYNRGNNQMITVIMNTPNLTARYSMTTSLDAKFSELFDAYFGLTQERVYTIFVACGQRLFEEDTPRLIGMRNRENIYAFVNARSYNVKRKKRNVSQ